MVRTALLYCFLAATAVSASPRDVPVTGVSVDSNGRTVIEVESNAASYYVLYRKNPVSGTETPVAIEIGQNGSTTLIESLGPLGSAEVYRILEHRRGDPFDTDGDGVDDIEELKNPVKTAPLNPAMELDIIDGAASIPDRATFEVLSYQGSEVLRDRHLADLEYVKFYILEADTDAPQMLFMNTNTHRAHFRFAATVGIEGGFGGGRRGSAIPGQMRGEIVYHPNVVAPNGRLGLYRFEFEPNDSYSFADVEMAYELMAANMPVIRNNLAYYPMPAAALPRYQREKALFDASRVHILLEDEIYADVGFMPLNPGKGFGLLRSLGPNETPSPRDIVVFKALPNSLPRVGGIITTVPQTPLSHVNLRAIQDNVPNAYLRNAAELVALVSLMDTYVYFEVSADGWDIRPASANEVDRHYADLRPAFPQSAVRDLSVREIKPLAEIGFDQSAGYGVKAANLAALRTFGFPDSVIPDGFAIPFYFYDEFMKYNRLYELAEMLFSTPGFQDDYEVQVLVLSEFRKRIRDGSMPWWMRRAITGVQKAFPEGISIRARSSTNNEDLINFTGAGLYTSKTHHPHEGDLSKTIKQVYAGLWNFRGFVEREFHRIDHFSAAMGVLLHPNFSGEMANGVAVTVDPFYGTRDSYYINAQVGEDLVTNPDELSVPEELLLGSKSGDGHRIVRPTNQLPDGERILSEEHIEDLRGYLRRIQSEFRRLYAAEDDDGFAMELEFKVTEKGDIAIKQARPWVSR